MLFFTSNVTTTETDNVLPIEILDAIQMRAIAGQEDLQGFRIGYTGSEPITCTIYSDDTHFLFSFDDFREFAAKLDVPLEPGKLSAYINVKLTAPVDALEGDQIAAIILTHDTLEYVPIEEKILTVNYFLAGANTGDSELGAFDRQFGSRTQQLLELIEGSGEPLELTRWLPYNKPNEARKDDLIYPYRKDDARSVFDSAQWANPTNAITGFANDLFYSKGFVGDRSLDHTQALFDLEEIQLESKDVQRVILPPEFEGFNKSTNEKRVIWHWEHENNLLLFQHTTWTLRYKGADYHLANIQEVTYFKAELLYFIADLHRVEYPHAQSIETKLPWNILYDERGKQAGYVDEFSTEPIDFDPYCPVVSADPYDPYAVCSSNPFTNLSTFIYQPETKGILITNWWANR